MRKFFQKFKHDCKGAVTVFVTLLLIPAVLVSGSGVDIARLYTARSEIRDANQLAANSALASYDALLQDLYGLYGIMKTDSELADMMDGYIRLTIFGEDWNETGLGTFALFQGSEGDPGAVQAASGKNLANAEVLRRQIEEYVKFRAPAIIVNEVLDKLDTFDKIKEDASVIKDKMDIEDKIEEIDKIYKRLYDCIQVVNGGEGLENAAVQSVNGFINRMKSTIDSLFTTRNNDYTNAALDENDDLADDYANKYQGLFDNLHDLVTGGKIQEAYVAGGVDGLGVYHNGSFTTSYQTDGTQKAIDKKRGELLDLGDNTTFTDDSLRELVGLAEDADEKKEELSGMVDDLERKLNSSKCSNELKTGLTVTKNAQGKTCIEVYRALLKYNVTAMATAMKNHDEPQLQSMINMLDNDIGYGNPNLGTGGFFSFSALKDLNENQSGYEVDLIIMNTERSKNGQAQLEDKLAFLDGIEPKTFSVPGTYKKFQDSAFDGTKNGEFYGMLKQMYGSPEKNTKKDDIKKGIEKLAGQIQDQFTTLLEFTPKGAWIYTNGANGSNAAGSITFGMAGDWGSSGSVKSQTKNALNDDLLSRIASASSSAANKILLLTYDSEMFSCYATNDGYSGTDQEEQDEPTEENMAGIPMGVKVNYYFQSELEYLYNGDLTNCLTNLMAVTGMIFLVRFVMDYTASFAITAVNNTVQTVESALSFLGPGAIVIGELVRLVMALGEGVTDVSRLKDGCQVALFKTNDSWRFSLGGLLDQIAEGKVGDLTAASFGSGSKDDDKTGFVYKDYMRLLLLLVDGDVLAQRTAKLIELNVTNYRDKIGGNGDRIARQNAMAAATLFDMRKAVTDFSVTTTVNLKMLFLSSPVAQKGYVGGIVPPKMREVTVTDYRGY